MSKVHNDLKFGKEMKMLMVVGTSLLPLNQLSHTYVFLEVSYEEERPNFSIMTFFTDVGSNLRQESCRQQNYDFSKNLNTKRLKKFFGVASDYQMKIFLKPFFFGVKVCNNRPWIDKL